MSRRAFARFLDEVRVVGEIRVPFRERIADASDLCGKYLQAGRREDAPREIERIHMLPTTQDQVATWEEDHFFRVELFSYPEEKIDVTHVIRVLQLVPPQAAYA